MALIIKLHSYVTLHFQLPQTNLNIALTDYCTLTKTYNVAHAGKTSRHVVSLEMKSRRLNGFV